MGGKADGYVLVEACTYQTRPARMSLPSVLYMGQCRAYLQREHRGCPDGSWTRGVMGESTYSGSTVNHFMMRLFSVGSRSYVLWD